MKKEMVTIQNENFRPGTKTDLREVVFKFETGAMGDYICWLAAIKYVAENYNYIKGHLVVPFWFIEIAANVMRKYPTWRLHSEIPERLAEGFPLKQPTVHPLNATGMHLIDLGFTFFAGINPVPEGWQFYPELDLELINLPISKRPPKPYAVMTPGATTATRTMPADVFNKISDHLISKGITPVYLGVTSMNKGKRAVNIDPAYDLNRGMNLIDRTTTLQAAKIMADATMVLGIDNGLLHLAACTKVPIIFGYTMVGPTHRRPYRREGHTFELYADKKDLPCIFCQERVRFFVDHDFSNCIYKDVKCVKALTAEAWTATIDQVLGKQ